MIRPSELISPAYRASQVQLHASPLGYGGKGAKWVDAVLSVATRYDCGGSILDYGCGRGSLGDALARITGRRCREYDPGVPGKDSLPVFADLVVCTDVLEHVEPGRLDTVLAHLRLLARKAVFVVVCTRPSNKLLPDGGNAHLIIEGDEWWADRMRRAGFRCAAPPDVLPIKMPGKAWIAVLEP